ncbi:MAG TPA: hypothetical protein DEH00_05065 [Candidatus Marinimicrobia bacterium]|nr:hypothetical protein [Candidatus Neomarinimicrobiota bacterium]
MQNKLLQILKDLNIGKLKMFGIQTGL